MPRPFSGLFRERVHPDGENCSAVVKHPIDSGTIRRFLVDDEYQSITAWSR
jgi:hypothetical protein